MPVAKIREKCESAVQKTHQNRMCTQPLCVGNQVGSIPHGAVPGAWEYRDPRRRRRVLRKVRLVELYSKGFDHVLTRRLQSRWKLNQIVHTQQETTYVVREGAVPAVRKHKYTGVNGVVVATVIIIVPVEYDVAPRAGRRGQGLRVEVSNASC